MSTKELNNSEILIAHPKTIEQMNALKAFMQALEIKFETSEQDYNPNFIHKIKESRNQVREGKTKALNKDNFKEILGLQ